MPYATLQNLCSQFGYREISQLLCDESDLLTEEMLFEAVAGDDLSSYTVDEQAAIAAALNRANDGLTRQSLFMDSKIGARYQLPLSASAIAAAPLEECCLALTRAYLADDSDNSAEIIEAGRKRWITWLSDLAKDMSFIPNAAKVTTGGAQSKHLTATPAGLDLSEY